MPTSTREHQTQTRTRVSGGPTTRARYRRTRTRQAVTTVPGGGTRNAKTNAHHPEEDPNVRSKIRRLTRSHEARSGDHANDLPARG